MRDFSGDREANGDGVCLGLVFVACHPVLPQEARVALTLRLLTKNEREPRVVTARSWG